MDELLREWSERLRGAQGKGEALCLLGGGSKDFYGQPPQGEPFSTRAYQGIVSYAPTELVITARCGTPLAEVEAAMREAGQMLAFEPPHFGATATIGGAVAAGLSGPRRPYAGAVRDFVLGARIIDGRGRLLKFGGQVMKNVAGFDVSRVMAGALGTLGLITEVSIKAAPLPAAQTTLRFALDAQSGLERFARWAAQPLPISASCQLGETLWLRLSGAQAAVRAARTVLGGDEVAEGEAFWQSLREQTHSFFCGEGELWRLSVKPTAPLTDLGAEQLIEWGGAQRWLCLPEQTDAAYLREWAQLQGGHATLFRGAHKQRGVFQPLPAALHDLHCRLKRAFDPTGILNPGRLYPDF